MCHSVPVSLCASTHYNIKYIIVTQRNRQPARRAHVPRYNQPDAHMYRDKLLVPKILVNTCQFTRDLHECGTPYSQCQCTTRQSNTLLWQTWFWLTEIEHISFVLFCWKLYKSRNMAFPDQISPMLCAPNFFGCIYRIPCRILIVDFFK
jgi:hypothetical protein